MCQIPTPVPAPSAHFPKVLRVSVEIHPKFSICSPESRRFFGTGCPLFRRPMVVRRPPPLAALRLPRFLLPQLGYAILEVADPALEACHLGPVFACLTPRTRHSFLEFLQALPFDPRARRIRCRLAVACQALRDAGKCLRPRSSRGLLLRLQLFARLLQLGLQSRQCRSLRSAHVLELANMAKRLKLQSVEGLFKF